MTNTRKLTFPVLNEVKRMFRKCIGKPLTDDDRERAARFDVAKEIEKAKAIRMENEMNNIKPVAWINKDLNYVELSTPSTVYGSHTIPLYTNTAVDSITLELEQQLDVAREFCRQLQIENKKLKAATTECYEKNLDLNLENFELKSKNAQLVIENNHLQFLLDSVMLEWCPDEMTEEQMENWSKHQKKVDTSSLEYYKSDTYKNNVKFSVEMIK